MKPIDRRTFVHRSGLAGLSLLAAGLLPNRATADPDPPATGQPAGTTTVLEPEIYPFWLGSVQAFVIHDGAISLDNVQPMFCPEAKPAEIDDLLRRNFLPPNRLTLSMNVLVIKARSGVLLFDSGAGQAFGPVGGRLVRGLAKIGISPADVKTIFITHGHMDHIGGLLDGSDRLVFASARIMAAKPEVDFWMSDAPDLSGMKTPPETKTQTAAGIKKVFGGVKAALELKEPGRILPEVELLAAPGHTPGHSAFSLSQGSEKLLVIGDAVHIPALQFPRPEWTMSYDVNPPQAIATRRKLFRDAAAERTMIFAYHLPFPGIGHIRVAGNGFDWVPKPWVG